MTLRRAPLDERHLAEFSALIRVLAHPVRLRIVELLEQRQRTVTELQLALGAPQAIVSQQLAKLRTGGVVACRREGTSAWYAVADPRVLNVLDCLRNCGTAASRRRARRSLQPGVIKWNASRS